ncbi:MAG TPA: LPS-assembly protein LptD, partial [Candidatus Cloacimonadota bacterium]|nr:LPS-assembly protein LptD [Candidatus Cloacimonadota bacterium]
MKEKLILLTICLVLSCLVLLSQTASPVFALLADSLGGTDSLLVKTDSLFYSADSIYYHQATEEIFLYRNTSVSYQNSSIASDSLHLDLKRERAYSSGPTVMQDADQILLGTGVSYDIASQEGILKDGRSKLDKGFYYGAEVRKVGAD